MSKKQKKQTAAATANRQGDASLDIADGELSDEQLSKVSGGVRAIRATGIRAGGLRAGNLSGLRFNPGDFGKF